MLTVLDVAKHVFWNDSMFDAHLLPSEERVIQCPYDLSELSTMTGQERLTVFKNCGIDPSLYPLFLRSLQHLTAAYGPGRIEDGYLIHRHLSANQWSPSGGVPPLFGTPCVVSEAYRDEKVVKTPIADRAAVSSSTTATDGKNDEGSSATIRYNGLLNQGATCYLNSLLQSLFHISAFRSVIYGMPTKEETTATETFDEHGKPTRKSIPYALQRLFCLLQTGTEALGTFELTDSFGWSSADSFTQHDVHELTTVLLDNIETKLQSYSNDPANKEENAIHRLFTGTLDNYIKVEEADYYGSREEPFYDLQLVVKRKRNIYESLDAFFQVEVLDGKNKYCLEKNGEKTYHRAEKGVRFKTVPPILLLHLARYDFDYELGETKIFTRWDYYSTLDLSKYMPSKSPEETHYSLCSVLVHSGSNAGFGHYFCFLRCSGSWYKFNDETVTPAQLREVFGSNFGGYKMNYWGSMVPHTADAYMLIYIRTSELDTLLRPISEKDVPTHVVEKLKAEEVEREQRRREREEDYLYGRAHFVTLEDVHNNQELLMMRNPTVHRYQPQRTLRALLESEALASFRPFAAQRFGIPEEDQLLWFAAPRTTARPNSLRLHARVRPGMTVADVLSGRVAAARAPDGATSTPAKECCILVTNRKDALYLDPQTTDADDDAQAGDFEIYHQRLFEPLHLRVLSLGSTVIYRPAASDAAALLSRLEDRVRDAISALPDDSKRLYGHHLSGTADGANGSGAPATAAAATAPAAGAATNISGAGGGGDNTTNATAATTTASNNNSNSAPGDGSGVTSVGGGPSLLPLDALPRRARPEGPMRAVRQDEVRYFLPCTELASGDVLVWQLERTSGSPAAAYGDIESFQHFLNHRIPVTIKLATPPYRTLVNARLADDMTYEQLQRYVAMLIGTSDDYDHIRFTRHNPDTQLPYYMKGKKRDRPTLAKLLTPATSRVLQLSTVLYYEFCRYTVTEIEAAHSLQFTLYSDDVKPISFHWVLLPRDTSITARVLFRACADAIKQDHARSIELLGAAPAATTTAAAAADGEEGEDGEAGSDKEAASAIDATDGMTTAIAATAAEGAAGEASPEPATAAAAAPATAPTAAPSAAPGPAPAATAGGTTTTCTLPPKAAELVRRVAAMDSTEAWKALRLVDVWRGRIYNVLDRRLTPTFENQTFEESAEYRIEVVPRPVPGVPEEQQTVVQVHHFALARQRKDPIETHGRPFSMYVCDDETPGQLLQRIANKLGKSDAAVQDWKVCLVRDARLQQTDPERPMGAQLDAFAPPLCWQPNQKDPTRMAFIGLEHADTSKRYNKKEGEVVILT